MIIVCLCFSLLSHFWLIHFLPTPALSTISRPLSSSMCPITQETANVGSSYNRMRGPGIGCWFSDRSNCSHWSLTLTLTLTSENLSLYTALLLVLVLIHLDSNYYRTRWYKIITRQGIYSLNHQQGNGWTGNTQPHICIMDTEIICLILLTHSTKYIFG